MDRRRRPLVWLLFVALSVASCRSTDATCRGTHWVGVWAASPSDGGAAFVDQSLRLVVNPTLGGRRVRVHLSNRYGADPVELASAFIARRASDAALVPRSARRLRFGRRRSVAIPPGGEVVSDDVGLRFAAFEDLAISIHVRGTSDPSSQHFLALETSYATAPGAGDHAKDAAGTAFTRTVGSWPYLTAIEVRARRDVGAVVAVGDSITDGFGAAGRNHRYPDFLARRLAAAGLPSAVANAGISGNKVLTYGPPVFGPSLGTRLDADVIALGGARVVILMEGTNDLGDEPPATADAVIAGLQAIVARLHAAGLRVILGTQAPAKGSGSHGTPEAVAARNRINDWIRTSGVADAVVDFHLALRDPDHPDGLRPDYDAGDHLHPSTAGYEAMANAVDLSFLADRACRP
jgi:lysophospholipase L1-like esterase